MLGITTTNARVGGFRGKGIDADATALYSRIIADGGVSNLTRLNFFVKGLKTIYGSLSNVPVCYDAHWIGYKLGSGTGATAGQAAARLYSLKSTENLLLRSEEFDNAIWVKSGVTVTANSVVSPTGTLTADLVTPTISDASIRQSFLPTGAIQHNYSIYLRSATGSSFSTTIRCWRDSPFSNIANTAITVTNEWQRFELTFTALDTTTHFVAIGASSTLSTGENLYAWGAQLNTGLVALPYTETTTTTQTLADAVQATAASQPLLLAHNGSDNYWWGSGVSGNFVSTPNAVANQITGDIEVIAKLDYKNNSDYQYFVLKGAGATTSYGIAISPTDRIYIDLKVGGTVYSPTSSVSISSSFNGFLKFTRLSSNGNIEFFTSTNGVTYTKLGATITSVPSGSITTNTELLVIGSSMSASFNFRSKISKLTISNSIGGAPVVDFNPASYNASTSQTAWTSATGEVWTINTGTATSGYKGVLVDRTIVQGDGVDDVISVAISGNAIRTQYFAHKSLGVGTTQIGGLYSVSNQHAQAFYYNGNKYSFYQTGAFDGPFGAVVVGTTNRALRISGAVGGTGTNWIPFQNGVDVSNGGNNIGLVVNYSNLFLFARGGGSGFDNAIFNTYIMSSVADNLTIRTATQAFAKTLNNNI